MSKIKYEIIFEERTIFDENYEELWLPNSVGFLDIHYYEYDDEESGVYDNSIHTGFNGPATGQAFIDYKIEFESEIKGLLELKIKKALIN